MLFKASLVEEYQWFYIRYSWVSDKKVHTFPNSISPKVNVIARLEFELRNFESAVQLLRHEDTLNIFLINS